MDQLATLFGPMLLSGVYVGCIYALVAVGFTIVFKAGGVLNFAQSALMAFAALFAASVAPAAGWPSLLAAAVATLLAGVASALTYQVVLRRLTGGDPLGLTILTMGLAIALQSVFALVWGSRILVLALLVDNPSLPVLGLGRMSLSQLLVVPITLVTFALLAGFVNGTHLGARLRAASEQPALAIRSGVNVFRVYVLAWLLAGLAAGLAGVLLGANTSANVSVADVGLRAFPAAVLGGFGSIPGALLGGLVVGLAQQAAVYFIGPTTADVAAYVVMMLALLIRPTGFLGERTIERS